MVSAKSVERNIQTPVSHVNKENTEWYSKEIPNLGVRPPFGYSKKGGDPSLLVADPVIFSCLSAALDQLDNGNSLRETTDSFNATLESRGYDLSLSHAGLKKLRVKYRPDYERKTTPQIHKKVPRAKRTEKLIKQKIANIKKSKKAVEKQLAKLEGTLKDKQEFQVEVLSPVIDLPPMELDKTNFDEEVNIAFEPNPGPQTEFLAAEEQEVLFGGAAGGEPVSGSSASFHRKVSK